MPYKYVKTLDENVKEPTITEQKTIEKPTKTVISEEESQLETVKKYQDEFFDEDDEIIEVNFD